MFFLKHIAYVEIPLLNFEFPTLLEGVDFIKFRLLLKKNQTLGLLRPTRILIIHTHTHHTTHAHTDGGC